ncbi:hypothetical protein NRS6110_04048 [Bacillus subtilis]|nr:hypothetical protein ZQL_05105 [Bacillus subtilis]TDO89129.1 hypothetical protein BDW29_2216 [Bacillus sp. AtDRG31]WIT27108.1 hypothetical protein [Bacillus phage SPbetaL2]CAF1781704.1 hypothetical protein NRS6111_03815 [Bacillus subtilis]CAF1784278.1 hypothetical protein NRS6110_04048 [Bacillus subtilis]
MIGFYICCALVSYLGLLYKYNISNRWAGLGRKVSGKDWLLIFLPIVNYFVTAMTIVLIIFDIAIKISSFFEDEC